MNNIKIGPDSANNDSSTSRTSVNKPSGPSRSDKDFKKILGGNDRQGGGRGSKNAKQLEGLDDAMDYEAIASEEEIPKQPSLFDLSKGLMKKDVDEETAEVAKMASADEIPLESPTSMFKNLALKEKAGASKESQERVEGAGGDKEDYKVKAVKTPNRFSQESIDLSYVNPLAISSTAVSDIGDQKLQQALSSSKITLQQLVEALVKEISTIESQGKTDTVVTLKEPPMFAGANVVLTSYESAKGEFNIRFENLSQQAQSFMNMQQNKESLLSNLQQKGYAVHIVVATTQVETPQVAAAAHSQQSSKDDESQKQQQDQRRNRQGQNEEEASA